MNEESEVRIVELDEAWEVFTHRLTAVLSTLNDGDEFTFHVVSVDGATDDFTVTCAAGCVAAELESSATGTTSVDFGEAGEAGLIGRCITVADMVVETIRDEYGLVDPGLMTVTAPAELLAQFSLVGLADHAVIRPDHVVQADSGAVVWTESGEELREVVLAHLRAAYDPEVEADVDNDYPLVVDGVRLWVRLANDQPAVLLLAPVVGSIHAARRADTELNILNRSSWWVRWGRRGELVLQELTIPGRPFVPEQFDEMVRIFAQACGSTRQDLSDRLRGKVIR